MKKITSLLLTFLFLLLFTHCAKQGEFITPSQFSNNPQGNFDAFWNGINQNYIFFDQTNVNWQNEYDQNRRLINSSTTKQQLFDICKKMFDKLIDGHRNLSAKPYQNETEDFKGGDVGADYLKYRDQNPFVNTVNIIKESNSYLAGNHATVLGNDPEDDKPKEQFFYGPIINKNIIYMRFMNFGTALHQNQNNEDLKQFIDYLTKANKLKKPLILDLRLNFGGYTNEFSALCGLFINKPYNFGFSKVKLGMGNNKLSPFITETIQPSNLTYFSNKVVIITNKFSVSSSELTCMVLKSLPNVIMIGEQTFGATGPISTEKEFTGNFVMPNNWEVQLAQRVSYDIDKKCYEGTGVPPDILVRQNINEISNNVDNQLDAAINYLQNNP